jgi:MSHA biogenesis protein MshP
MSHKLSGQSIRQHDSCLDRKKVAAPVRRPGWRLSGHKQHGIGLPAAIFVITLMITIAVGVNLLVRQNAETFEEELRLTRAFYAAESGAGFAMNALFPPDEFPAYGTTAICPENAGSPRLYEFEAEGLEGCSVEVSCVTDATVDDVEYYTITSTGSCGEVSRTIQVRSSFRP